jgi:hypothetical protein
MSLVSRLLGDVGLDLGPTTDELSPPDGESRFAKLNEEILQALDAAWNAPPRERDWADATRLESLRSRAATLAGALGLNEPWGWADPRNSLTLPFWKGLFPDLRVLVCVRDPRAVAASLAAEKTSAGVAVSLWEQYYGALLDSAGDDGVVTHLERFRDDPEAELERLARALGLDVSRVSTAWVAAGADVNETGPDPPDDELPERVGELYERLRAAAASPAAAAPRASSGSPSPAGAGDLPDVAQGQRRELEHLRLELARARGQIEAFRVELAIRSTAKDDTQDVIVSLEEQLTERDRELQKLRKELYEGAVWRTETEASLTRGIEILKEELTLIKSTRLWRVGQGYWTLKARLRGVRGRGRA